jgi:vacuolar protein sorting-associated protein 3
VDTVLAKLFAQSEKTTDLYALLQEPNDVVLSEVEKVLQEAGQYSALCMIYKQRGDDEKLLVTWSKCVLHFRNYFLSWLTNLRRLVDGQWTDDDIGDPLSSMLNLLTEKRDRALTKRWSIWLTKRDPERALKVCLSWH